MKLIQISWLSYKKRWKISITRHIRPQKWRSFALKLYRRLASPCHQLGNSMPSIQFLSRHIYICEMRYGNEKDLDQNYPRLKSQREPGIGSTKDKGNERRYRDA